MIGQDGDPLIFELHIAASGATQAMEKLSEAFDKLSIALPKEMKKIKKEDKISEAEEFLLWASQFPTIFHPGSFIKNNENDN